MAKAKSRGKTIFLLGLFALATLVIIGSFLTNLFTNTFPNAGRSQNKNETIVTSEELGYDPLVTVVPTVKDATPAPIDSDPRRGPEDAPVTIVEFGNFQCADCADIAPVLQQVLDAYPDEVRLVWKDFPLPALKLQSQAAAEAARCAQEQDGFWEYHDLLFLSQDQFINEPWVELAAELEMDTDEFESCFSQGNTTALVTQGYLVALSLGIEGSPTLYINDQVINGIATFEEIKRVVDEELRGN